jgi:hypothetical protein
MKNTCRVINVKFKGSKKYQKKDTQYKVPQKNRKFKKKIRFISGLKYEVFQFVCSQNLSETQSQT